mgnify:CR=1 FL=1
MGYYIDDLGLEYPDLGGDRKQPHNLTLNRECGRANEIIRAFNFAPNVHRQMLNYVEDAGIYAEQGIVYPNNMLWKGGKPYFDGATASAVEICNAHNIRERDNRNLFTFACTINPETVGVFQTILSADTRHVQIIVGTDDGIRIIRESQLVLLTGTANTVKLNRDSRVVYVFDANRTIDGVNRHFVYVNGIPAGTSTTVAGYSWFESSVFRIGAKSNNGSIFHGTIDNVVWSGGAWTPAQILADARNPTAIYKTI